MFASCIACGEFTAAPRRLSAGLMCPACARFMRAALDDLDPREPSRAVLTPDGWRELADNTLGRSA